MTADNIKAIAQTSHTINPYIAVQSSSWGSLSWDTIKALPEYNFHLVEKVSLELRQREEEESVITTMVLNDDRPFHPQRLWQTYLEHLPNDVYRSKGFFYLPTRDSQALMWNQSGASIGLEIVGH